MKYEVFIISDAEQDLIDIYSYIDRISVLRP